LGGRAYFEPPPLKRMSPWVQDGSDQCDVIAGGVDESGLFKGVYVSGVHLMALMRTFQLSKVFMPCDVPTPVAYLGQNLSDGVPLVIVTRGCFGREMDYGPGPVRNDVQKTIWQTARDMRAEMPQILITCIDVPNYLGSDMMQACLESPLNEYRELMYQDGTWYTPTVVNAAPLGKWMSENVRSKIPPKEKARQSQFNRKKFDWQDTTKFYANMWCIGWRAVLEVRPAPDVPRRTDLKFTAEAEKPEVQALKLPPSAAEAAFKKALAKARAAGDAKEILSAATKYLENASAKEKESLLEATMACEEARSSAKSDKEAFEAVATKFKALVSMNSMDEAMELATGTFASQDDPVLKAKALLLLVTCHSSLGDLNTAVEVASSGNSDISKLNNDDATCEALKVLVDAQIATGDVDAAIASASDATSSKGKVEACGQSMLAAAKMAKAFESLVPADARALAKEAAEAQKKAAASYKSLGSTKEAAEAFEGAAECFLKAAEFLDAAAIGKELQELGKAEQSKSIEASGFKELAKALLGSSAATTGGLEEMLTSAKAALALYEEAGDAEGKASAMQVVADALLTADGSLSEAYRMAKGAANGFKALGKVEKMCTALLTAAKAGLKKGDVTSAFWDAKQIVSEGFEMSGYSEACSIVSQIMRMAEDSDKPISVGGPVPVSVGDAVTFV